MMNYWWVTRPKRKLNSIPEVLATFAELSLNEQWAGQRDSHLSFEDALEKAGLKRKGERRDQTGGGARTYRAWVASLGLIFTQEATGKTMLTLAGEAIMAGDSPVDVLTNQILKYQFPSAFSISRGVQVSPRFKIRPFRFLLRLLMDDRIMYLTEEEIAKVIVTEAETETEKCYEYIVSRIRDFRERGDAILSDDFFAKYSPSKGMVNLDHPYSHLTDLANTLVNWLEYTQLIDRPERGTIKVLEGKEDEVSKILATTPPFVDRPDQQEYYQRKYGLDPKHRKDTRNLTETSTVTAKIIAQQQVRNAFIALSLRKPIAVINAGVIDSIVERTGIAPELVEETLLRYYPTGAIGGFLTEYFEMAFKGRDEATEFEKATVAIFRDTFGFDARHVGPIGLTPDVLLISDHDGYSAILDNKAYRQYTISNDHHNRMVHNYIGNLGRYYNGTSSLAFFSYIAGGFGRAIDRQLGAITEETGVPGSAMPVSNMIDMIRRHQEKPYSHEKVRDIFSVGRQVIKADIEC